GLQRGRAGRPLLQDLSLLGLGVPGAARSRRECQRGRDSAYQARERGLGARRLRDRTDRTDLHRTLAVIVSALSPDALLRAWERGEPAVSGSARSLIVLREVCPDEPEDPARLSVGRRDALLLALRQQQRGVQLPLCGECPRCEETVELTLNSID